MKKIILITSLLIGFISTGYSTHLMGGEIVVQHDSGDDYQVLLTLYRDASAGTAFIQTIQSFVLEDQNGIQTVFSMSLSSGTHPVFGLQQGTMLPMSTYPAEIYFFDSILTLPTNGTYTLTWTNCCRNAAILNLPNALSNDMTLSTSFKVDNSQFSSTPYFMVMPVINVPVNTPWQYNPLPFDPDLDSLSWYLGSPNSGSSAIPGYTLPASDPNGVISIDAVTGTISWTASLVGNWVYTVICEEWRNGIKIGEIRRDMQFIVLGSGSIPSYSNLGTIPLQNGYPTWSIDAGQVSELRLLANDNLSSNPLSFVAFGESFVLASNPSTYSTVTSPGSNEIETYINWSPTINEARTNPYITVLRLFNGTFAYDETIFIEVRNATSIKPITNNSQLAEVYPNPTNGLLNIPLNLTKSGEVTIRIFNSFGQILKQETTYFSSGNKLALMQLDLPVGQYTMTVHQNNMPIGVKAVSVTK
jgi:hypothetical protein